MSQDTQTTTTSAPSAPTCGAPSWRWLAFLAWLALGIVTIIVGMGVNQARLPDQFGNQAEKLSRVQANTDPCDFTFLVTGDAKHGLATLEHLIEIGEQDFPAFMIIVGDFASDCWNIEHRFICSEMARWNPTFPIMLAPGNHEVDPKGEFTIDNFERLYGASQFHIMIGKNLFIVLNNVPPYDHNRSYIEYLKKTVAEKKDQAQRIYVFMHVPPAGLSDQILCRGVEGSEEFIQTVRELGVDYVFMGDHHGYVKVEKDPTTFIVCGGGGSPLRGPHGHFHHMMRISIRGESVTETVIAVQRQPEFPYLMKRNIAVYLWPWINQHWLTQLISLVLYCFVLWSFNPFKRQAATR